MRFPSRVGRIGGGTVTAWDIHHAALEAQRRGEDVIVLSVGDPDFPTPKPILDGAIAALRAGDTHYTDIPGRPSLRSAIAQNHATRLQVPLTIDNVIVLAGAQNGLFSTSLCLFDPGDEVIAFDPVYLTYQASIEISGAKMIGVPLVAESGFRLDESALARAVTSKTRGIFFANPNNPTGAVLTRGELDVICEIARRHDLWVVSDEVYACLTFDRPHISIASLPGMAERTATIGSLSKSHAMTGWRVGWVIAPKPLIDHINNLALCMLYGIPGFVQEGAVVALAAGDALVAEMRDVYRRRRDLVCERIAKVAPLHCVKPKSGMFCLVDVRGSGMSAGEFSWRLFREAGVSVLDAGAFGQSANGYVRVSFTLEDSRLSEACSRIARFVDKHWPPKLSMRTAGDS